MGEAITPPNLRSMFSNRFRRLLRLVFLPCLRASFTKPLISAVVTVVLSLASRADESPTSVEEAHRVLVAKCVSCHGPEKQEGGLRLDSLDLATKGGDRGPSIVPGDGNGSLLIQAITFDNPDLQMPPRQKLSDAEISILKDWIQSGAAWPETNPSTPASEPSTYGPAIFDAQNPIRKLFLGERLDLWSLKPITSPAVAVSPGVASADATTASRSIDEFIEESLAGAGLSLSPEADSRTLIRRLTFDLTGLPPMPDDVAAFVSDRSADAYEHLVDRLLNSPRYGERQARLWLDVVRYADTNGYERDEFRPLMWRYRDYVVRSFNQDKPFDQFVLEQLAGDLLVDGEPRTSAEADALIATGYLRLGQWDSTAAIFQEEDRLRAEMMADVTNTTASAFLGLTYSCCQCHDHKYDPLTQADHYRLRAFFAGMKPVDDLAVSTASMRVEIEAFNAHLDEQIAPLKAELEKLPSDKQSEQDQLTAKITQLESMRRQIDRAMGVREKESADPIFVFYQGDFGSPREEVSPGIPSVLGATAVKSQRRRDLANWITSPDNPWTARVIVNRIWQQHFGTGLVATANDFGYSGAKPTHPELLDWLAADLMNHGWSIKRLHRMIVTSAVYRQTSQVTEPGRSIDPDNRLLWRQDMRRLDAETLRDSLLAVSGLLKLEDNGKPRWPSVPQELLHAQPAILEAIEGKDEGRMQGWYADTEEAVDVRSLFLVRKRCLPIPFLQAFDLPETTVSCARRDTTVVAPQALMLLNSPESMRYSQAISTRLLNQHHDRDPSNSEKVCALINELFQVTLARVATDDEVRLATEFLHLHQKMHEATSTDAAASMAFTDLCRAVLNLNEFIYVD